MYKRTIAACTAAFFMTACGGGQSTELTSSDFAYETQRDITVSIAMTGEGKLSQNQILLYDGQKVETSPVGDQVTFDGLLTEGITNNDGLFTTKVTLGNHLDSIWVVVPTLSYANELSVVDNKLNLTLTKGL